MMKRILTILVSQLLAVTCVQAEGERYQTFSRLFETHGFENDSTANYLKQWEQDEPRDAEMLYSHYIYDYLKARPQIAITEDLKEAKNSAMLPDTISRFGEFQIKNCWILKDSGSGMEHFQKALGYMRKAIGLHPNILELYYNANEGLMWKYEHKYAVAMALDVLKMHKEDRARWTDFFGHPLGEEVEPVMHTYMNELFGQLISRNEFELATILNDTLQSMYPEELEYKFNISVILINSFREDQALEQLTGLLPSYPNDGNILNAIAVLYRDRGDMKNFRKYAKRLSQSNEKHWAAAGRRMLSELEPLSIDFQDIERWMKKHKEEYASLVDRFKQCDTNLTMEELALVYFGHACTDECQGTKLWDVSLDSLFQAGDLERCQNESRKCLERHPASIAALTYAFLSGMQLSQAKGGQEEELEKIRFQLMSLCDMIKKNAKDVAASKVKEKYGFKGSIYYKILWREDENAFVKYLMTDEEKAESKSLLFSNPPYFF